MKHVWIAPLAGAMVLVAAVAICAPAWSQSLDSTRQGGTGTQRGSGEGQSQQLQQQRSTTATMTQAAGAIIWPVIGDLKPAADLMLKADGACKFAEGALTPADAIISLTRQAVLKWTPDERADLSQLATWHVGDRLEMITTDPKGGKSLSEFADVIAVSPAGPTIKDATDTAQIPIAHMVQYLDFMKTKYHQTSRILRPEIDQAKMEKVAPAIAAWSKPDVLKPLAAVCLSERARGYVLIQGAWPADASPFTNRQAAEEWAVEVTAEAVMINQWARAVASQLSASTWHDASIARAAARQAAIALAPQYLTLGKQVWERLKDHHRLIINQSAQCRGTCWAITDTTTGQTWGFQGQESGWNVSLDNVPWAGQGLLAGAKAEIAFAESGVATLSETFETRAGVDAATGAQAGATMGVTK